MTLAQLVLHFWYPPRAGEAGAGRNLNPVCGEKEITAMDRRLTAEDVNWLRKMRDAGSASRPLPAIPIHVARKLTMLGCAMFTGRRGEYSITLRGRDELVDRELENELR
jgi:hypothetical protein